ncbi:TonB-dependent receptor [Chryseosolibacter indicus]|uniref:TonB-dependent receptor n=1 Tax=Chryseosolibacter indicus TaxID=2782351 RepID=A0ABS5VPC3_9BACT|nr:TonB-dependent receptor [Chryseosolibacter indicus]MBT1703290.1 TonB-dependent receptor [Chryseosolibacter indicus]
MDDFRKLTTQEKALRINLSKAIYGSFAEIGAGQEVAANFFKVGGASGTIAKTISAYDMKFSDAIYGVCDRYVCEDRLMQMLDHEYVLLPERLPHRIENTRFFAFADTVEILNYERTNQGHGWMGLRFQLQPKTEPNECVIHIKMHDTDPLQQQLSLGYVGVNMLYGCMFMSDPEEILMSLLDGLTTRRIEIDMFRLSGPDFKHVDNRLMALKLVKNGLTKAAMFGPDGNVMQPSDELYKKNVLVLRGRFRPPTHVNVDMLLRSRKHFRKEPDVDSSKIVLISELTLNDLSPDGKIDEKDFLHRADIICSLGQNVLISNYFEYYRLVDYLSRITKGKKIGIILGIYALQKVFEEKTYENIRGGILECFASLFGHNVKLYIYPALRAGSNELFTLKDFEQELPPNLKSLFRYLMENNKMEDICDANTKHLHIISDNVLAMIKKGEPGWEKFVPHKVEEAIKSFGLFDYPLTQSESEVQVESQS